MTVIALPAFEIQDLAFDRFSWEFLPFQGVSLGHSSAFTMFEKVKSVGWSNCQLEILVNVSAECKSLLWRSLHLQVEDFWPGIFGSAERRKPKQQRAQLVHVHHGPSCSPTVDGFEHFESDMQINQIESSVEIQISFQIFQSKAIQSNLPSKSLHFWTTGRVSTVGDINQVPWSFWVRNRPEDGGHGPSSRWKEVGCGSWSLPIVTSMFVALVPLPPAVRDVWTLQSLQSPVANHC